MSYRVVAPYITARTSASIGIYDLRGRPASSVIVGLYKGALLPPDVPADDVARLLADGLIEEVPTP